MITYEDVVKISLQDNVSFSVVDYLFAYAIILGATNTEAYNFSRKKSEIGKLQKSSTLGNRARRLPHIDWLIEKMRLLHHNDVKKYIKANNLLSDNNFPISDPNSNDNNNIIDEVAMKIMRKLYDEGVDGVETKDLKDIVAMIEKLKKNFNNIDIKQEALDATIIEVERPYNAVCPYCHRETFMLTDLVVRCLHCKSFIDNRPIKERGNPITITELPPEVVDVFQPKYEQ